MLITGKTSQQ